MSYVLWAVTSEIQAPSCELRTPRYESQDKIHDITTSACASWWLYSKAPGPLYDSTVPIHTENWQYSILNIAAIPYNNQQAWVQFLIWLFWAFLLQYFVNSTGKFNSLVAKTVETVLCSSCNCDPLKFKEKHWRAYNITTYYLLLFNPC